MREQHEQRHGGGKEWGRKGPGKGVSLVPAQGREMEGRDEPGRPWPSIALVYQEQKRQPGAFQSQLDLDPDSTIC